MNRTRIKFCGLTRPGDVRLAVELGVDALGFVLNAPAPARINPAPQELPERAAAKKKGK